MDYTGFLGFQEVEGLPSIWCRHPLFFSLWLGPIVRRHFLLVTMYYAYTNLHAPDLDQRACTPISYEPEGPAGTRLLPSAISFWCATIRLITHDCRMDVWAVVLRWILKVAPKACYQKYVAHRTATISMWNQRAYDVRKCRRIQPSSGLTKPLPHPRETLTGPMIIIWRLRMYEYFKQGTTLTYLVPRRQYCLIGLA